MQHLVVDGRGSLVRSSETIACLVDLRLGENLDDQELSDRITRFAKLTVRGNNLLAFYHSVNLPCSRSNVLRDLTTCEDPGGTLSMC